MDNDVSEMDEVTKGNNLVDVEAESCMSATSRNGCRLTKVGFAMDGDLGYVEGNVVVVTTVKVNVDVLVWRPTGLHHLYEAAIDVVTPVD